MTGSIRIGLVDNDLHRVLAFALEMAGYRVDAFARADDATLAALIASPPDLVITDSTNPPLDGYGLVTGLRRHGCHVPVLIYSAHGDQLFSRLLQSGIWVDGFINKPSSNAVIAAQIRTILDRQRDMRRPCAVSTTTLERGDLILDTGGWSCLWKDKPVVLTAAEFRILAALAGAPGVRHKPEALRQAAYGNDDVAGAGVINTHVRHIQYRLKMIDPDCDIIEVMYGVGFRMRSMDDGGHRQTGATVHSGPARRAGDGAGGTRQGDATGGAGSGAAAGADVPDAPRAAAALAEPACPYAGILAGELIGHRFWWMIEGRLCSVAHKRFWTSGETVSGDIDAIVGTGPRGAIRGGVYAFASPEKREPEARFAQTLMEAAKFISDGSPLFHGWGLQFEAQGIVAGTVKMWGDVVEHEHGYRAQFAKLNSLDTLSGSGDLDRLRRDYGV